MLTNHPRAVGIAAATALSLSGLAAPGIAQATPPSSAVSVTVDSHVGLGTVPETGIGVNDAVWDTELGSETTSKLLRDVGTKMIRYPGGSYGDIYHWKDNTAPGGYVAPNTDFDTFMTSVRRAEAQPMIIANYGSGTAQEAADWVSYANLTQQYHARYWEIGNEIYGNGHYGANWETDNHADKGPAAYAAGVVEYAKAMKAVDPSIKIGAVLTTPGNWPDGIVADGDTGTWNQVVLSTAGPSIDFVVLHWYPGGSSAAEALGKPAQAVDIAEQTRAQIQRFTPTNAARIGISMTETSPGFGINTQPGALFTADTYPSLWAAGVFNIDWWDVRNGMGKVSTVAGQTDYGDGGMFSSGNCNDDKSVCEPPLNTPFAPYYALSMLNTFSNPGDQLIRVTTSNPLVRGHAVRRPDGGLAVLLLNEDPDNAQQVALNYPGYLPSPDKPKVFTFRNGATGIESSRTGTATSQTLPAYSMTSLLLRPKLSRTLPPVPPAPVVSAVTDATATVTLPPAPPGVRQAGYDVYLQDATSSRLVGHTFAPSLRVTGLRADSRYTVTAVARDIAGAESLSSPAVAFTTGVPTSEACTVHVAKSADWGNGYVANLDVTNTGSTPIDGWKLEFAFPRPWLSFGSGWNGTWQASGTGVSVTNADTNASIAPGATVGVGYVGNYAGPNVLPRMFTLNGKACGIG